MLPIELTIEGLYSYKEKQVINFENLTSSWLFGIFGKVGSGKSSIIDAITLAVYGEVERLGQRDNKNYNLMNLDSNELFIEFICKVIGEKYSFIYHSKKTRKGDKVNTPEKKVSIFKNDEWVTIDKSGEEILNISYRNFKQAVVIPQGKFQEFISQKPTERTEMLSEIFNLKKYDLSHKIKILKEKANSKKDKIEGLLSGIPNVNEDELNVKKNSLKINKELIIKTKNNIEELELTKTKITNARVIHAQYNKTVESYDYNKNLMENLKEIEEKIFFNEEVRPIIIEKNKVSNRLQKNIDDLQILKTKKITNEDKLLNINKNLDLLNKKENDIKNKELFKEDFENILKINFLNKELEEINANKIKNKMSLMDLNNILNSIEESRESIKREKELLEKNIDKNELILELTHWHLTYDNLVNKSNDFLKQIDKFNNKIKDLIKEKNNIKKTVSEPLNISLEDLNLMKTLEYLKDYKLIQEDELQTLKTKKELSNFTKSIQAGKECPLCGSINHPNVIKIEFVDDELNNKVQKIKENNLEIERIKNVVSKIEILDTNINNTLNNLSDLEINHKKLNIEINDLKNNFKWSEKYQKKEELDNLKIEAEETKITLNKLNNDFDQYTEKREEILDKIKNLEFLLNEFKVTSEFKENEKIKYIKKINKLNFEDYKSTDSDEILSHINDYNKEVEEFQNELIKNTKSKEEIEKNIEILQSQIPRIIENIDELQNDLSKKEEKLKKLTINFNKERIEELINEIFDLKTNKEEVKTVKEEFNYLKIKLKELIDQKSQNPYSELEDSDNKEALFTKKEEKENLNQEISRLDIEIKNDLENLEKHKKSNEEKNIIIKRFDNLVSLEKLFKGKKFVQYVADFYLKNLVLNANKRFSKLTKHQLSLDLDENSNFIVKDFLNSGRTRLLKTLSGGQTFQASFCIALALAESINSIKTPNKEDNENFFFIDEGFGSLDKDSLRLVFNTLNSLRYEERIVGVISHVEDFKKEVDVSITIKRDKKNGSIVKTSW